VVAPYFGLDGTSQALGHLALGAASGVEELFGHLVD